MESAGYQVVHPLTRSGTYALHRGRRLRDGHPVLIKSTARTPPGPGDAEGLERELRLLRELEDLDAPRPVELVRTPDVAALVLEDDGLLPLPALLQGDAPGLPSFFRVARALCDALARVHARGLVHGAIAPATVFTTPAFDRAQLVDFSRATRAAFDAGGAPPPGPESAAYVAPEQTGRINRRVDHRADLYSLGATLYELLTGAPPFPAADTLELIHAHIARVPKSPSAAAPHVPEQLSRIVMRLLAKEAPDRYQTAAGLARDLERCERDWLASCTIEPFDPGLHDVSDRFLIPQKLYGRDREMDRLVQAFARACDGASLLVVVSGPSGTGKTSLIAELCRSIVRERGTFASGKFDQVVRETPYGALVQAIRSLVWQVLTESEDRLASWRERLSAALGAGASVLAEVVPDLEFVLGRLPTPPRVEPVEAQNRLRLAFENFIGTMAGAGHPLVVFLDDLQWVDAATLHLLPELLSSAQVRHVLFIGACRSSEVDESHPLSGMLAGLEGAGAPVERVPLGPLDAADVERFVADTLRVDAGAAGSLAEVLLRKTDATPLFLIQFLNALHQRGLIAFDSRTARWVYHLAAVEGLDSTEDVADLLQHRMLRLTPATQELLTWAACLGGTFDSEVLEAVSGRSGDATAAGLSEAAEAGLLTRVSAAGPPDVRSGGSQAYAFGHDRVQQAAYNLVVDEARRNRHLDIGRHLLLRAGGDVPDERIFAIAQQFNLGAPLVRDDHERRVIARLNLEAARRARQAGAYEAARAHLEAGIAVLQAATWSTHYELLFPLHLEAAECRYLAGRLAEAERDLDALLARAGTPLDAAQVHTLRIVLN